MIVTVLVSTVVWLTVTFMTSPEPDSILESFYTRVRPGGPGGGASRSRLDSDPRESPAARSRGRTGSPALSRCMQHCSGSAR
jgi:hypothetical protein